VSSANCYFLIRNRRRALREGQRSLSLTPLSMQLKLFTANTFNGRRKLSLAFGAADIKAGTHERKKDGQCSSL